MLLTEKNILRVAQTQNHSVSVLGLQNISSPQVSQKGEPPREDIRIRVLRRFLSDYSSPLVEFSDVLVSTADLWGLDYALIPAIAMQESGGCKKIPENSYNCWGYGVYGTQTTMFDSYPAAIAQIAKTMKEAYIKSGLTNVTLVEDKWVPPSRGQWSYSVNYFIGKIREYERTLTAS